MNNFKEFIDNIDRERITKSFKIGDKKFYSSTINLTHEFDISESEVYPEGYWENMIFDVDSPRSVPANNLWRYTYKPSFEELEENIKAFTKDYLECDLTDE